MNEILSILLPAIVSVITGVAGWFVGRRKRDNDLLQEQSGTVRLLLESNQKIMQEYTNSQEEKMKLREDIGRMREEIKGNETEIANLRRENERLRDKLKELQKKLDELIAKGRAS